MLAQCSKQLRSDTVEHLAVFLRYGYSSIRVLEVEKTQIQVFDFYETIVTMARRKALRVIYIIESTLLCHPGSAPTVVCISIQ